MNGRTPPRSNTPAERRSGPGTDGLRVLFGALGLFCVTLVVFAPVRTFSFLTFDDQDYVVKNAMVREGITARGVAWAFTSVGGASNWHPLTWLSHMLDVQLFGLDAGRHHLTSVVLHALAAAILFRALHAMTGSLGAALLAAAFFALHPLHVQSVAWVSERKDVLAGVCGFACCAAWGHHVRRPGPGSYAAALVAFTLGLMAKQTLVTLPIVLLLLDWWPLGRYRLEKRSPEARTAGLRPLGLLLLEKLPFFALAAGAGFLAWTAQARGGALHLMDADHRDLRWANALVSSVAYLAKTIWPSGLAYSYPFPTAVPPAWTLAGAATVLLGLSTLAFFPRRRAPWLAVGWGWYLVLLAPVSGIVKIGSQGMADRYTYLPLVGIFVALAWALRAATRLSRHAARMLASAAGALALAALLPLTRAQLAHWRDTPAVFARLAAVYPQSSWWQAVREFNRGSELFAAGRNAEARQHFAAALRLRPRMSAAYNSLGAALMQEGLLPEAEQAFRSAIAFSTPPDPGFHENLALVLNLQGRSEEAEMEAAKARRLRR